MLNPYTQGLCHLDTDLHLKSGSGSLMKMLVFLLVLKSVTSRPVGWIAHKSVGKFAHGHERWVLQREIRLGVGAARGGGKAAIATYCPPPPTEICVTHTETVKNGAESKIAWHFGPEDLVITKFIVIVCKKRIGRAFSIFLINLKLLH